MAIIQQADFVETDFARYNCVSFIGAPQDDSVLFVGQKIAQLINNLEPVRQCLVFIEEGVEVPARLVQQHNFVLCASAIRGYALFAQRIAQQEMAQEHRVGHTLTPQGYYIGKDVTLGENVLIEPGVLLGHGVSIGSGSIIRAHSVIRWATIGANCLIKSHAVIGDQAFTLYTDGDGHPRRVFCLGSVQIEHDVEVGSFTTVCRGQNTATTVGAYSKLDDHVHVGHDVVIGQNTLIAAGAIIGGYNQFGDDVYMGMNATTKQLISIESGAFIPMGARVGKDVKAQGMFGAPQS
ncbi:MAG: hypothetical protein LBU07_04125 [Coriobacteriales bacterium]|jgi:UDP-3-O-[3-hydroxymyristoyl] glucosamine N-acyltransferase|nr:hypothetical protein [Coriobacteriales bacterium]